VHRHPEGDRHRHRGGEGRAALADGLQDREVQELSGPVTALLRRWNEGDRAAAEEAVSLVYDELRALARRYFRRERAGHTLEATAVVNEAFLRLAGQPAVHWENRAHFIGLFAHVMRRVLVDYARGRNVARRGGRRRRVTLVEAELLGADRTPDLLALDAALVWLAERDAQKSAIVELRFFGGLSIEETASCLGVSPATVNRQWRLARAWLYRQLASSA
jgi:RNA polymerase sigma factor (TIGR02999 family)